VKKVVATRATKHLKKSKEADASLEAHRSTSSSDDVRGDLSFYLFFTPCVIFILTCLSMDRS
jgi:hypothetical protein